MSKITIPDSIVVSIPACHAGDPGSIPGQGVSFFLNKQNLIYIFITYLLTILFLQTYLLLIHTTRTILTYWYIPTNQAEMVGSPCHIVLFNWQELSCLEYFTEIKLTQLN